MVTQRVSRAAVIAGLAMAALLLGLPVRRGRNGQPERDDGDLRRRGR